MQPIQFSKEDKAIITEKIQHYFEEKLHYEIGAFDAEFLLDFLSEALGAYYYNRGLEEAQAILNKKLENITEAISELEKPTSGRGTFL